MTYMRAWQEEFEHEEALAEIAGVLNAQHARLIDIAARAQREGGWFGEGIHSFAHWLTIHPRRLSCPGEEDRDDRRPRRRLPTADRCLPARRTVARPGLCSGRQGTVMG